MNVGLEGLMQWFSKGNCSIKRCTNQLFAFGVHSQLSIDVLFESAWILVFFLCTTSIWVVPGKINRAHLFVLLLGCCILQVLCQKTWNNCRQALFGSATYATQSHYHHLRNAPDFTVVKALPSSIQLSSNKKKWNCSTQSFRWGCIMLSAAVYMTNYIIFLVTFVDSVSKNGQCG